MKGIPDHSAAHGSGVIGVRPVTEMLVVQTLLWELGVVCCAQRQGSLSILSQSNMLKLGTGLPWGLTCDEQVSHLGEVNDSHQLCTTETRYSTSLLCLHGSEKDLT